MHATQRLVDVTDHGSHTHGDPKLANASPSFILPACSRAMFFVVWLPGTRRAGNRKKHGRSGQPSFSSSELLTSF